MQATIPTIFQPDRIERVILIGQYVATITLDDLHDAVYFVMIAEALGA